jgi:hypothetical protein
MIFQQTAFTSFCRDPAAKIRQEVGGGPFDQGTAEFVVTTRVNCKVLRNDRG